MPRYSDGSTHYSDNSSNSGNSSNNRGGLESSKNNNSSNNRGGLESSKNKNNSNNRGGLESYKNKKNQNNKPPPPPPPPDDDDSEAKAKAAAAAAAKAAAQKEAKRKAAVSARDTALQGLIDAINADYSEKYGVTSPGAADSGPPGMAPKGGYYNDLVKAYVAEHNPELLEAFDLEHEGIYADIRGKGVYDPTYYNTQKSALDEQMTGQKSYLQELAEAWAQGHIDDDLSPILTQALADANALTTDGSATAEQANAQLQAIKNFDYSKIYDEITTPVADPDDVPEFFDKVYTPKTGTGGTGANPAQTTSGGPTPGKGVKTPTMYYGGGPPPQQNQNRIANSMYSTPVGQGSSKVIRG